MIVHNTGIEGLALIEPKSFGDKRGFFIESFQKQRYRDRLGIEEDFVQDNHSRSHKGVLRGMHFQTNAPQGKLVRCVSGSVYDVAVDLRKGSKTYGEWFGAELSAENKYQLWIPAGMAHGFLVLSDTADFEYKCTDYYDPSGEGCLLWNDPLVGIKWPDINTPLQLSEKDTKGLPINKLT